MTVLVTGGAGFIGGHTVLALLDRGETPVVLDDLSTGTRAAVPVGVPLHVGDVGDIALISRLIREYHIDGILHFAAKVHDPGVAADPFEDQMADTHKNRALLQAAARADIRHFIFSSSAAVYGNQDAAPIRETATLKPVSAYGRSKLVSEQMLADADAADRLRYVALRYFNVAGADPKGRHGQSRLGPTHLIKVALEAALGRRSYVSIQGFDYATSDGTCVRDYIHVSDLAEAHLVALEHLRCGGTSRVLNCGYGRGYSAKEVVHAARMVAGTDFEVRHAPRRAGETASAVVNANNLIELGWRPELNDLPTMIEHTHRWERGLAASAPPHHQGLRLLDHTAEVGDAGRSESTNQHLSQGATVLRRTRDVAPAQPKTPQSTLSS